MIGFEFSSEQKLIQQSIREFAKKELVPLVRIIDDNQKIPSYIIKKMAELGILVMNFTQDYGGSNADPVFCGIVAQELARWDISCAIFTFFLVECAWGYILEKYGTEKIKNSIVSKVTLDKIFLGIAATKPDAGSDLANIRAVARKLGNKYVISVRRHLSAE
ncbi:MAG: acyl-CoA dehydrogenase family protein [candidate division WOR-3 bacterium]